MPKQYKRLIILTVIVLLVVVSFITIYNRRFRVIDTVPNIKGVVSTSFMGFRVSFNRDLKSSIDYLSKATDPEKHIKDVGVDGHSIIIRVNPHAENKRYKFSLNNIEATDGSIIDNVEFDYVAKYIDVEQLSDAERSLIQELSTGYLTDYPIIQFLPYSTLDFKLEAELEQIEESAQVGDFFLKATIFLSAADVRIDRDSAIKNYKKSARGYIESIGFNPDDYDIKYEIVEPSL